MIKKFLVALKEILNIDSTASWEGPKKCSHDIVGKNFNYEVKSTILKTDYKVGIHSSLQLEIDKPSKLFFARFERKPYCLTINSLVREIVLMGYKEDELELCLEKEGFSKGSRWRNEGFDLLELNSYEITKEDFPIINLAKINELAPKKNIVGCELSLDLSGVNHQTIF